MRTRNNEKRVKTMMNAAMNSEEATIRARERKLNQEISRSRTGAGESSPIINPTIKTKSVPVRCKLRGTYEHKAIKLVREAPRRNASTLCEATASHKLSSPTKSSAK